MAIKITGIDVIDNNRDFFGRDATFTGSITSGGTLTVGGDSYFNGVRIYGDNKEMIKHDGSVLYINKADDFTSGTRLGGPVVIGTSSPTPGWTDTNDLTVGGSVYVSGNINSAGRYTGAIRGGYLDFGDDYPCFKTALNSDFYPNGNGTSMAANTWYTVQNWHSTTNLSFDIAGNFNHSTGKFTAPVTGIYEFSYNIAPHQLDESTEYFISRGLHKNSSGAEQSKHGHNMETAGGLYLGTFSNSSNISLDSPFSTSATWMVPMNVSDTMEVQVRTNSDNDGGTIYLDAQWGDTRMNFFSGKLISVTTAG